MKRCIKLLFCIFLAFCSAAALVVGASAEHLADVTICAEIEDAVGKSNQFDYIEKSAETDTLSSLGMSENLVEEYNKLIDAIPKDIAELLPKDLFSGDIEKVGASVSEVGSFGYIFDLVCKEIGLNVGAMVDIFAKILGVLLLCGTAEALKGISPSGGVTHALVLCLSCVSALSLLSVQYDMAESVIAFFDRLIVFINAIMPIICTLYAMGGNVTTAIATNGGTLIFLNICENICSATLMPVVGVLTSLAVAGAVCPTLNFKGLMGFVKRTYTFFLSAVMLLLTFTLSIQTTLSSSADNVALRGAKMLAGSAIPVVGGSIGDTLKTVVASVKFIRSTVGVLGVVVVLLMFLPLLVSVVSARLGLIFSGACADLLGCERESKLISGIVAVYGYMLAVICICSVGFVFILALFIHCSVAMG